MILLWIQIENTMILYYDLLDMNLGGASAPQGIKQNS